MNIKNIAKKFKLCAKCGSHYLGKSNACPKCGSTEVKDKKD